MMHWKYSKFLMANFVVKKRKRLLSRILDNRQIISKNERGYFYD